MTLWDKGDIAIAKVSKTYPGFDDVTIEKGHAYTVTAAISCPEDDQNLLLQVDNQTAYMDGNRLAVMWWSDLFEKPNQSSIDIIEKMKVPTPTPEPA